MQQTGFFFSHLHALIAQVHRVISLFYFFFITIAMNVCCDWLPYCGSPNEKICCSHAVERSRKVVLSCWVGCLRLGLFVHGGSEGGLHIALGDWQTDLYSCAVVLSHVVGFTISPHSHVHGPTTCTRDPHRSTPLSVADLGSGAVLSPCIHALHFQAL